MRKTLFATLSTVAVTGALSVLLPPPEAKAACLTASVANNCVTFDPSTPSLVNKNVFSTTLEAITNEFSNRLQLGFIAANEKNIPLQDVLLTLKYDGGTTTEVFGFGNVDVFGNNPTNFPPLKGWVSDIRSINPLNVPKTLTDAFLTYTIGAYGGVQNGGFPPVFLEDVLLTELAANDAAPPSTGTFFDPNTVNTQYYGPGSTATGATIVCTGPSAGCTVGPDTNFYTARKPQVETTKAPGPLPIFGAGMAFAYSRKLRRRINLQPTQI
jgi:hypothetical protein